MSLRRQVHAVNRGASRPGQQVGVQKPHAGQVFQHRLQLGGDAGTAVKLGLVDENGQVVSGAERSVSFDGYKTPILDTVTAAIRDFIAPHDAPALAGIGVSATGQIDSRRGVVACTCGNFPGLVHIFNPQLILIGGGVSAQQELLIDPLAEKVRASVMPAFAEGLELKSAALQNDAGLVGAVYYFKKHHD